MTDFKTTHTLYYKNILSMDPIEIGKKIKEKFSESNLTINEFAELLNCERTNVYRIFERKSVDSELLCKISKILKRPAGTRFKSRTPLEEGVPGRSFCLERPLISEKSVTPF